MKILIVDDNQNSVNSLAIGLKRVGCFIEKAHNGREGLEKLEDYKFDYIISDIDMPEMDGWEFGKKVIKKHPDIKMIFMSARENINHNFKEFPLLIKPFSFDELLKYISKKYRR